LSKRILPSTLTQRCMRMVVTSLYVNAYFKRLRRIKQSGRHSRDLCGPTRVVKKTRAHTSSVNRSSVVVVVVVVAASVARRIAVTQPAR